MSLSTCAAQSASHRSVDLQHLGVVCKTLQIRSTPRETGYLVGGPHNKDSRV